MMMAVRHESKFDLILSNGRLIIDVDATTGNLMTSFQRQLPGGHYRITAAENEDFTKAVGGEIDGNGRAHPLFYYIATQAAMGISVSDLCALCEFDVIDGPMMAQSHVTFDQDLMVDCDYQVSGRVISLTRKTSRTFGELDLLTYELTLSRPEGERVAHCVNQWILPRRARVAA